MASQNTLFFSGEDEARQKLASCPKRMQGHRSTHAQWIQVNKLPRSGGDISSDHLYFVGRGRSGTAATVPWVLHSQRG